MIERTWGYALPGSGRTESCAIMGKSSPKDARIVTTVVGMVAFSERYGTTDSSESRYSDSGGAAQYLWS